MSRKCVKILSWVWNDTRIGWIAFAVPFISFIYVLYWTYKKVPIENKRRTGCLENVDLFLKSQKVYT